MFIFPTPAAELPRGDVEAQQRAVAAAYAGVGWEVPRLLDAMAGASDFYFDTLDQVRMDTWSTGRVKLLGDAGYYASPMSGRGTSQALLGAYVLAGEPAAAADHTAAFAAYERAMRAYVEVNHELGRQATARRPTTASRSRTTRRRARSDGSVTARPPASREAAAAP